MLTEALSLHLNADWFPILFDLIVLSSLSVALYHYLIGGQRPWPQIPVVTLTGKVPSPWSGADPDLMKRADTILAKGKAMTDGCFQIKTGVGFKIIVPNRFSHELRNHKALSISHNNRLEFLTDYHGFDGMREGSRDDNLIPEVLRVKLTQSLALVTGDIVEEAAFGIEHNLGNAKGWAVHNIKPVILDIVARITARVFAGKELSRNASWVHIAKQNTLSTFAAAEDLKAMPNLSRPFRQWLSPSMWRLRQETVNARNLLESVTKKRLEAMSSDKRHTKDKQATVSNFWAWVTDQAKGRPIDFAAGQLFLSIVAIHTTTEIAMRCVMQLCQMPNLVTPLREELLRVLQRDGWTRQSLYKMKLLDSFIKEVHRTYPLTNATMGRFVVESFQLSDGTKIPRGSSIAVLDDAPFNVEHYLEPDKFDAHRFLKLREAPGAETKHQYVELTDHNLSFGHGEHACPGRFFASMELKIILCFILLRYDLSCEPGKPLLPLVRSDLTLVADPRTTIRMRRRCEEIDLLQPTTFVV